MNDKPIVRVRDVMKTEFDMVEGMDTVADVLRNSKHPESKCFIVNIRHPDDEYGIVLLSDIAKKVLAMNKAPNRVNIYEIMSKPVIYVDPEMDIRYCTRLFDKFGLSYAPVIDNGELKGIVSYASMVLRGLCRNEQES